MTHGSSMRGTVTRTAAVAFEQIAVGARSRLLGHGHDVPHLCFLLEGAFEERDRGRWRHVAAGTLRSSPAGDQHDIAFLSRSRCLLILMQGDVGGILPAQPTERRFSVGPRIRMLATALAAEMRRRDAVSPLIAELHVLELLAATVQAKGRRHHDQPPRWLSRVRDRIRADPAQPPTAAELAAAEGYHPVHVARVFRAYYGIGLGEYARLARAERARELLAASAAPLAQIASVAGYSDQSHLTRAMRRLLGVTPAEVRRRRGRIVEVASIQDAGDIAT